jgi:hypothetical protein
MALATTQKGNMSVTKYVNKLCALGADMAVAGKPLADEEMVSYILVGLDIEYNSVVSAAVAWVEPISVNKLYGQLLSFDTFFYKAPTHHLLMAPCVGVKASDEDMAAPVGTLEGILETDAAAVATSTIVVVATPTTVARCQHAKSATRKDTEGSNVGTGSIRTTTPKEPL